MEFPQFDKIKINNAIITFLIITSGFFAPLALYVMMYHGLYFTQDIIKTLIMIGSFGFTELALIYFVIALPFLFINKHDVYNLNDIIRLPIILGSVVLLVIYSLVMFTSVLIDNMAPPSIKDVVFILCGSDAALLPAAFLFVYFINIQKK